MEFLTITKKLINGSQKFLFGGGPCYCEVHKCNTLQKAQQAIASGLGVALGCRASAIIYRKTQDYDDYPLIIAINTIARQLTLQPIATFNRDPKLILHNTNDIK